MLRSEKTEDEKNLIVPLTLLDCFQQCYADEEDYSDLLTLRIDHFAPVHFLSGTGIAIVEIKCLAKGTRTLVLVWRSLSFCGSKQLQICVYVRSLLIESDPLFFFFLRTSILLLVPAFLFSFV
jgi:hypothetical protein